MDVYRADVSACLLNLPENCLLPDPSYSSIHLGLPTAVELCGKFQLPSHPLLESCCFGDGA